MFNQGVEHLAHSRELLGIILAQKLFRDFESFVKNEKELLIKNDSPNSQPIKMDSKGNLTLTLSVLICVS